MHDSKRLVQIVSRNRLFSSSVSFVVYKSMRINIQLLEDLCIAMVMLYYIRNSWKFTLFTHVYSP